MSADSDEYSPIRSLLAGVGIAGGGVLASGLGAIIAGIIVSLFGAATPMFFGSTFALAFVESMYLLVGTVYAARTRIDVPIRPPTLTEARIALQATLGALALAFAGFGIIELTGLTIEAAGTRQADAGILSVSSSILVLAIVALSEEYLFRGVIQRRISLGMGDELGLVASSLVFGLIHVLNFTGDTVAIVLGVLILSTVGAVFGYVYQFTRNLTVPVTVHFLYNSSLVVLSAVGITVF